jgi:hypothetical protein
VVDNPFCTARVRPGAIPFLFPPGETAADVVARFRDHQWRGQIVGPHGSGKSTLLAALLPEIERAGRAMVLITLHDGQRRLPFDPAERAQAGSTVVAVDGYEQLGAWRRLGLRRLCRRRGLGLLATSHAPIGLPTLLRTEPSPAIARRIVATLLGDDAASISPAEIDAAFARHGGNIRELLFGLYDLYESRRSSG